jgi:hypothetical protein
MNMKTNLVRKCSVVVAAGLTFFLGCARPQAETTQPKTVVAPPPPLATPATNDALVGADPAAPEMSDTNAPAILDRIPPTPKSDVVTVSPGLDEVIKLVQAGVSEEVIFAFIERHQGKFNLGADQIVYLNDLGVASAVITAMLKHDGSDTALADVATAPAPNVQTQIVSNVPQNQAQPVYPAEQAAPQVQTVAPPPTSTEVTYFYDALAPYGSWVYLSGYGWCWQPTVAVTVPTWRPYCDRGRWYWSDAGWYWHSDYSWGWAPFHYGRWYHHPRSGWLWSPGTVWAPAWVSWRYYDGYCGWAPLPPSAHFVHGVGFTYHGRHVSVGFDFGLSYHHYAFVSVGNFCDYAPYRYVVPHTRVRNFYRNTTVINNYHVRNQTIINHGVGRETIARSGNNRIREVAIREKPVRDLADVRGETLGREGSQLVVHKPKLPSEPPRVRSASFAQREKPDRGAEGSPRLASKPDGGGVAVGNGFAAKPDGGGVAVGNGIIAKPNRDASGGDGLGKPRRDLAGEAAGPGESGGGKPRDLKLPGNLTNQRGLPRHEANESVARVEKPQTSTGTIEAKPAPQLAQPRHEVCDGEPLFGKPSGNPATRRHQVVTDTGAGAETRLVQPRVKPDAPRVEVQPQVAPQAKPQRSHVVQAQPSTPAYTPKQPAIAQPQHSPRMQEQRSAGRVHSPAPSAPAAPRDYTPRAAMPNYSKPQHTAPSSPAPRAVPPPQPQYSRPAAGPAAQQHFAKPAPAPRMEAAPRSGGGGGGGGAPKGDKGR